MNKAQRAQSVASCGSRCLTLSADGAVTVAELVEDGLVRVWRGSAVLDRLQRGMTIEFSVADEARGEETRGLVLSAQVVRQDERVAEVRVELGDARVEAVALGAIPRT